MAKIFDKDVIFGKLKDEAEKKGFNMNPDIDKLPAGTPTVVDILEVVAIVINDLMSVDNSKNAEIKAPEIKLNSGGVLKGAARKDDEITVDITTDSNLIAFFEAFYKALEFPVLEPGNGSPSVFQAALGLALKAFKPTKIKGKITTASDKIKIS
jgi:hypothetical protein